MPQLSEGYGAMNWISVTERLPKHRKEPYLSDGLLFAVDFGPDFEDPTERYSVWFGVYCGGSGLPKRFYGISNDGRRPDHSASLEYVPHDPDDVTHWMPLPEPPQ